VVLVSARNKRANCCLTGWRAGQSQIMCNSFATAMPPQLVHCMRHNICTYPISPRNMLAMLCHAMPCHAMLCHAMLCYAMLCHAMPCYAMLSYGMPCYDMHEICMNFSNSKACRLHVDYLILRLQTIFVTRAHEASLAIALQRESAITSFSQTSNNANTLTVQCNALRRADCSVCSVSSTKAHSVSSQPFPATGTGTKPLCVSAAHAYGCIYHLLIEEVAQGPLSSAGSFVFVAPRVFAGYCIKIGSQLQQNACTHCGVSGSNSLSKMLPQTQVDLSVERWSCLCE